MPTNTVSPYSPYQPFNQGVGTGMAVPQFFGQMQIGGNQHTFTPWGTGIAPMPGSGLGPGSSAMGGPLAQTWQRQPGLRGGTRGESGSGGAGGDLAGNATSGGSLGEGIAPINSTIDGSTPLYTPQQTTAATNQAVGKARQMGNPRQAMKAFSRPGMSHDEGTLAAAMPQITAARAQAQQLAGMMPLEDEFANQNFMLQGQVQAGQETSALARLLQQLQQTQDMERNSATQAILNPMLGSVFG